AAINSVGQSQSQYTTITVNPGGTVPVAQFTANPTTGNAPLAVQFTDTSTGSPTSWFWSFGDGTYSNAESPVHTYLTAGHYQVVMAAINSVGQSQSQPTIITVNPGGSVPVAQFTANPITGTAPLSVQFTDTSTGSPTSWYWSFGDGTYSTQESPVHTYSTAGYYQVVMAAINSAGQSQSPQQTIIVAQATPKITWSN